MTSRIFGEYREPRSPLPTILAEFDLVDHRLRRESQRGHNRLVEDRVPTHREVTVDAAIDVVPRRGVAQLGYRIDEWEGGFDQQSLDRSRSLARERGRVALFVDAELVRHDKRRPHKVSLPKRVTPGIHHGLPRGEPATRQDLPADKLRHVVVGTGAQKKPTLVADNRDTVRGLEAHGMRPPAQLGKPRYWQRARCAQGSSDGVGAPSTPLTRARRR